MQSGTGDREASESGLGRPELVRAIREWICRYGPMTFDRFMEMALYEPELGYYTSMARDASGQSGALVDYQTSPQVHRAFGYLIARQLARFWDALDRPNPFVIVELGAGVGELAGQVLGGLAKARLSARVVYHAVDLRVGQTSSHTSESALPSSADASPLAPPLSGHASQVPTEFDPPDQACWWRDLADLGRAGVRAHCILSNEFFDALPVHRVAWIGGRLCEVYVDRGRHGFVERLDAPSDAALERWIADSGSIPPEGWRGEICLRLTSIVEAIARILDRGFVLTMDYGDETAELFREVDGTLVAYHRHHWTDDVLRRVGEQDLTSHVDFGALVRLGRQFGLEPVFLTTQRDFLLGLGLAEEAEPLVACEPTDGRRWQARFALAELVRPDGLGRLKVLVQRRALNYRIEQKA